MPEFEPCTVIFMIKAWYIPVKHIVYCYIHDKGLVLYQGNTSQLLLASKVPHWAGEQYLESEHNCTGPDFLHTFVPVVCWWILWGKQRTEFQFSCMPSRKLFCYCGSLALTVAWCMNNTAQWYLQQPPCSSASQTCRTQIWEMLKWWPSEMVCGNTKGNFPGAALCSMAVCAMWERPVIAAPIGSCGDQPGEVKLLLPGPESTLEQLKKSTTADYLAWLGHQCDLDGHDCL